MQSAVVTLTAAGASKWIPVDPTKASVGIAFLGQVSTGSTLTYKVQHTLDNPYNFDKIPTSITRATTTATLTSPDHFLAVGDTIIVSGAGDPFDGTYAVAGVTDANVITYTVANSGLSTANQDRKACFIRALDHSTFTGKTATADGNYAFPIKAMRFNITAYTAGKLQGTVTQGRGN